MSNASAPPFPRSHSLASTLWLLMLVPLGVFGAGIYVTWTLDQELVDRFRDLAQKNLQGTVMLRKVASEVALARRSEKSFFIAVDSPTERARYRAAWQERLERARDTLHLAQDDKSGRFSDEEQAQLRSLEAALERYATGFKELANTLEKSSAQFPTPPNTQQRSAADWNSLNRRNVDHLRPYSNLIDTMAERRNTLYSEAVNAAEHTHRRGDTLVLVLHLLAIGLLISLILYAMRTLRLAITTSAQALDALGRGKLMHVPSSDIAWDADLRTQPRDFDAITQGIRRVRRLLALQQGEKESVSTEISDSKS